MLTKAMTLGARGMSGQDKRVRAKHDVTMRFLEAGNWSRPHFRSLTNYDGLGEIRISAQLEHRLIGVSRYRWDSDFTVLISCTHKGKKYDPQDALNTAYDRYKSNEQNKSRPVVNRSQPPIQVADGIHTPVSLFVSWDSEKVILGHFWIKNIETLISTDTLLGSIAHQIRALREKSGLNQKQFGDEIGKPQSVVSRLEDTEYGGITVNTLLDIAKARNVGLKVEFTDLREPT